MGFCTCRNLQLTICTLQLIALCERQVFEFLAFLWIPILVNFLDIIFVILGFFGAFQYRPKYITSYLIWHVFWFAWNVYIICLYLDIGILDHKESIVLKVDQWSESWWVKNGPGCQVQLNVTHPFPSSENVTDCLLDYRYVEIFQAGLQSLLALFGLIGGFCLSRTFLEEDDSSSHKSKRDQKRMSLYSIEFSTRNDATNESDSNEYDTENHNSQAIAPKPMTPRRVKRRSVMQRGTTSRHSTNSRRHSNNPRSSTRSSRRSVQNPVTRLVEQQQKMHQQQHHHQQYDIPASSMDVNYHDFHHSSPSSSNLMPTPAHHLPAATWQMQGHANPTYQQSSSQSLNEHSDFDELYNNRPPSARSSYSNFHGTRAINYGQQQAAYQNLATPQVPQKGLMHTNARHSLRSKAFLNNGPPAYTPNGQGHPPADSETTI